jgi:hypothetical protein
VLLACHAATTQVWQVVAVTVLASLLTPVNAVSLATEISHLPGPARSGCAATAQRGAELTRLLRRLLGHRAGAWHLQGRP